MPSLVEEPRMGTPRSLWDVDIFIKGCEGLPRMDYVGHADPYVKLRITTPDGTQTFDYKTSVIYNTGQPIFDEEIRLHNVPVGAQCNFQIWDKDHLTHDDHIGCCEVVLDNDTLAVAARSAQTGSRGAAPPWPSGPGAGGCQLRLPIRAAPGLAMSTAGVLLLALRCRATCQPPGPMLHCGPVRYRRTESRLAGAISGLNEDGCYAAYKLSLAGLPAFFPDGAAIHWNTSYDKARQIFGSSAITNAVRAQHAVLYQDKGRQGSRGVLRGGGDLVSLLRGGVRAQQRRYYTYVLTADGSWCFSETGAAFFADFVSKHAMHAGCAEHVVCAGEFCLLPRELLAGPSNDASADPLAAAAVDAAVATAALDGVYGDEAGGWTLLIDNNSGTYAPPARQLPPLAALLEHNFPGLRVEALPEGNPRLAAQRARVPSRING
ncbi:hypothetical protein PLESTF_000287900 [Pleodorina starrii]|nr:hypothetical protein PLESTF_000287900 [Pleodorina starrii]